MEGAAGFPISWSGNSCSLCSPVWLLLDTRLSPRSSFLQPSPSADFSGLVPPSPPLSLMATSGLPAVLWCNVSVAFKKGP